MGWLEIYSQTEKSNLFSACQLGSCDLGSGENFINFDIMPDSNEYHFKLVWDEGKNDFDDYLSKMYQQPIFCPTKCIESHFLAECNQYFL